MTEAVLYAFELSAIQRTSDAMTSCSDTAGIGREIAAGIPGAQHFSVDGAAHHVPSEAPDAVTAAVRADSRFQGSSLV